MIMRYTTPEQAKRLENLGIDIDTADMMYYQTPSNVTDPKNGYAESGVLILHHTKFSQQKKWMQDAYNGYSGPVPVYFNPCWSSDALIDIISKVCERLEIALRIDKNFNIFTDKAKWVTNKPFLDTLVETVCKLIENGDIEPVK